MFPSSLPTAKITNPDVTGIINSTEIQSIVRAAGPKVQRRPWTQHKNPLKNKGVLFRLNPYAKSIRRAELLRQERKQKANAKKPKQPVAAGDAFLKTLFAP
jgi:large subunit ribosomal protein L4e